MNRLGALLLALLTAGCSDDNTTTDVGPNPDTGPTPDIAWIDAGDGPVVDTTVQPDQDIKQASYIKTPFKEDQVLATCAIMASCVPAGVIPGFTANACIEQFLAGGETPGPSVLSCMANATTGCGAMKTCLGSWIKQESCSPTMGGSCDGQNMVKCLDTFTENIDCQMVFGVGCVTGTGGGGCSDGTTCSGSSLMAKCKGGTRVYKCVYGYEVLLEDCARKELPCVSHECAGPGELCSTVACEGGTIAFCVENRVLRMKCSDIAPGFSCSGGGGTARCEQGTACSASSAPTCNGNKLVVCSGGKQQDVDCTTLGFSSCSGGACN